MPEEFKKFTWVDEAVPAKRTPLPEAFVKVSAVCEAFVEKKFVPVAVRKVRLVLETLVEETVTICMSPELATANFTDEATSKFKKSPL